MNNQWIIGLDCAVDPRKVGVALGRLSSNRLYLEEVHPCSAQRTPVIVASELVRGRSPVLFAVDAPLGWPCRMAELLVSHRAGEPIPADPNAFVRRETDRVVKQQIGVQPLDVGADRIARTALTALATLQGIAATLDQALTLAWDATAGSGGPRVVEVYPAATLKVRGLPAAGYKRPEQIADRASILEGLRNVMAINCGEHLLLDDADALDAVVCVLAGADFLRGHALAPADRRLAEREGWIWVRTPNSGAQGA